MNAWSSAVAQQFGVAEGVGNALGGDRVLVVAGIADERPAGTVRLAEEIRHRRAGKRRLAFRAAHPFREFGREVEHLQEIALDVLLVGLEFRIRPAADDQRQAVVRRRHRESAMGADVGFEPTVHRQTAPIGVVAGQQRRLFVVLLGPHGFGDEGMAAVRARPRAVARSLTVSPSFERPLMPTTRPSSIRSSSTVKPSRIVRAGLSRGVDQQLVEDGPPRAVRDRRVCRCPATRRS